MEDNFFWYGTLAEMIDKDILDHGLSGAHLTDGFIIGKRGKAKFWMFDPTANGFYKIYQQDEIGDVTGVRYVDANTTMVTVLRRQNNL